MKEFCEPVQRKDGESDADWFHRLGWKLLEYKCAYYRPEVIHPDCWKSRQLLISDWVYDRLEKEYAALAAQLGLPDTISRMTDFDWRKPSCRIVLSCLSEPYRLNPTNCQPFPKGGLT